MTTQKFIIHISGASCSGKTSLTESLGKAFPGIYLVSFDKLKWQLAGYHRDKDALLIKKIMLGLFEAVCKQGIPIQMDSGFPHEDDYRQYKNIADNHGYTFIFIELTAPEDVLIARFRQRLESASKNNTKLTITSEELYIQNLSRKRFIPNDTQSFDTSKISAEEIVKRIIPSIEYITAAA